MTNPQVQYAVRRNHAGKGWLVWDDVSGVVVGFAHELKRQAVAERKALIERATAKPTASERWAALVAKAEALGTNSPAFYATMDAETNARDTFAETGRREFIDAPSHADEQAEIAYGSLCWTTIFQENADVRAFFEAAGYRW